MPLGDLQKRNFTINRLADDGETILHKYPYNTLPLLKSHLHPKFVIYNAGIKLSKLLRVKNPTVRDPEVEAVYDNYPADDLNAIIMLHEAWTRSPSLPDGALEDPTYVLPNTMLVRKDSSDDGGDGGDGVRDGGRADDSDYVCSDGDGDGLQQQPPLRTRSVTAKQTESGRADGLCYRQNEIVSAEPGRAAAEQGRDPQHVGAGRGARRGAGRGARRGTGEDTAGKRRKVTKRKVFSESSAHNQQFLSEATLNSFDRHFGVAGWTGDSIRQWSSATKKRCSRRHLRNIHFLRPRI